MAGAQFNEGSWWPAWEAWLQKRSGKMVSARKPGDSAYPVLDVAPGRYVAMKATV
jgi:polyhydroxyalkanoate synthase